MKCLSLFSGIGGFDLALRNLGHEIVGACEIDKYARQVYARHFPGVPIYNDATTLQPESLPQFDLLCGGFPCQAFSVAGKRRGFDDCRGTLFFEIARIAKVKKPRYLLLENVRGLLNHNKGETFRTILSALDEVGYDAEWQVINGKYFLPQNRERIFIVGHLRGQHTRQIFPLGDCDEVNNGTRQEAQAEGKRISGISPTVSGQRVNSQGFIAIPVLTPDRIEKRQNGRRFKEDGDPSFTLTAQDKHGVFDGKRVRRLTPTECERLQGFPDGWTSELSDTQRYKCLGNAVMVTKVQYIASHLT